MRTFLHFWDERVIRGQIEKAVVLQVKDTKTTYTSGIRNTCTVLGIGSDTKNVKKLKIWIKNLKKFHFNGEMDISSSTYTFYDLCPTMRLR